MLELINILVKAQRSPANWTTCLYFNRLVTYKALLNMYCSMMQQIVVEQWKHLNTDTERERIRITFAHALGRVHDENDLWNQSIQLLLPFQILILVDWFFVNSTNHISTWARGTERSGYAGEREEVITVCTISN